MPNTSKQSGNVITIKVIVISHPPSLLSWALWDCTLYPGHCTQQDDGCRSAVDTAAGRQRRTLTSLQGNLSGGASVPHPCLRCPGSCLMLQCATCVCWPRSLEKEATFPLMPSRAEMMERPEQQPPATERGSGYHCDCDGHKKVSWSKKELGSLWEDSNGKWMTYFEMLSPE